MVLLIMFAALLVLLALRVPVWIALLIPSIVYIILDDTATAALAAQQTASGVFDFALLAVPMFILLGNLANVSGATDRLFDAATSAIGHVRGSLGYVNIATSFGFSWMSGAAISDAAAMGRIQVPAMKKRGYPEGFALGITGASSLIAPMIPPSIPAIIYAVTAGALREARCSWPASCRPWCWSWRCASWSGSRPASATTCAWRSRRRHSASRTSPRRSPSRGPP